VDIDAEEYRLDRVSTAGRALAALGDIPRRIGRPATRTAYIAQIDGLRFLAIAVVLVWHIALRSSRYAEYWNHRGAHIANLYGWFPHGEVGVGLFFFISGYIIAQPFLSRPRAQWKFADFYLRRLRRIYPPYLVAATLCLLAVIASGYHSSRLAQENVYLSYLTSLFYMHGMVFNAPSTINPPMWSLELEIQFYALIPYFMLFYLGGKRGSFKRRLAVAAVLISLAIIGSSLLDLAAPFDGRFRYGLLSHVYLFCAGVVVADYAQVHDPIRAAPSLAFDGVFALGLATLFGLGLYLTRVDARPGGGWPDILAAVTMLVGVVAAYFGAMRGKVGRALMGDPWLGLIGAMCFSIYLVHIVVVEGLASLILRLPYLRDTWTVWVVHLLVLAPAALGVSAVFYLCVERPFMTGAVAGSRAPSRFSASRQSLL
jgi:peptidoglycan/LPS O-acetylase OafA/YrhL